MITCTYKYYTERERTIGLPVATITIRLSGPSLQAHVLFVALLVTRISHWAPRERAFPLLIPSLPVLVVLQRECLDRSCCRRWRLSLSLNSSSSSGLCVAVYSVQWPSRHVGCVGLAGLLLSLSLPLRRRRRLGRCRRP